MITIKKIKVILCVSALSLCILAPLAGALDLPTSTNKKDENVDIKETHPTIELTMDKSELIHLEEEAGSIIVGSPVHINVLADSAHTLVVVPRQPGASHFSVLDKHGNLIMQRRVIVAGPTQDYLRVKRTCTEDNCKDTSIYYCPEGMCHEIEIPQIEIPQQEQQ